MVHEKIFVAGELYAIEGKYPRKGDAVVRANIARKTKLFKSVRVIKHDNKYLVCVRGVNRDLKGLTAKKLSEETGLKGTLEYDRRTGRMK